MAENNTNQASQASTAKAVNNKKRITIAIIVIVAVLALGIGLWQWHNTPAFCGSVCHTTMSEHLTNYENGPGIAKVHADNGLTCLDCHEADLNTQVSEVEAQLSGTYGDLTLASGHYVDNQKCLDCHGGSYEALAEQTSYLDPYNPHNSPHGQIDCDECHKGHAAQVDQCGECHDNGGQHMLS